MQDAREHGALDGKLEAAAFQEIGQNLRDFQLIPQAAKQQWSAAYRRSVWPPSPRGSSPARCGGRSRRSADRARRWPRARPCARAHGRSAAEPGRRRGRSRPSRGRCGPRAVFSRMSMPNVVRNPTKKINLYQCYNVKCSTTVFGNSKIRQRKISESRLVVATPFGDNFGYYSLLSSDLVGTSETGAIGRLAGRCGRVLLGIC